MEFHENLHAIMKEKGLTIPEVARMSGLTDSTVRSIFDRKQKKIALNVAFKLSKGLGVSLERLNGEPEPVKTADHLPSETEMEHIKKYRGLDDYGKEAVDDVLDVEYRRVTEDREKEAAAARWRSGKQKQLMRFLRQKRRETEAADEPANVQRFPVPYYLQASSAGYGEWAENGYAEEIDLVKRPPFGTSFIVPVNGDSMEPTYPDGCKVFVRRQTEIRVGEVGIFFMDGKQWIKELGEGELISHNPAYPTRPMTDDICCQGLVLGICDASYFA